MEACRGAHHWGRIITALGHEVRLIPACHVTPYVRRGKTDANDAAAIVEAMVRPGIRPVPVKSIDQQAVLVSHRARRSMIKQRTQSVNAVRSHLAEFGIVLGKGRRQLSRWFQQYDQSQKPQLPQPLLKILAVFRKHIEKLDKNIASLEAMISKYRRQSDVAQRLTTISGTGLLGATALAASYGSGCQFGSARQFAAFLGLTPRHRATGGIHGREYTSKRGDAYIRALLLIGARVCLIWARKKPDLADPWMVKLLERKAWRVAMVAVANKLARIAWAIMTKGGTYHAPAVGA